MEKNLKNARRFPMEVLPKQLRDEFYGASLGIIQQQEMITHFGLNIIGSALSNSVEVEPTTGWIERPNLFSVILSNPGGNKSGIYKRMIKPVEQLKLSINKDYISKKDLMNDYNKKRKEFIRIYRADNNHPEAQRFIGWMNDNGIGYLFDKNDPDAFKEMTMPAKPISPLSGDGTTEGREKVLAANNGRSLLIAKDEFTGLIKGFNQYKGGRGSDMELFLTYFDYGSSSKDNVSDESSHFYEDKCISVLGGTQQKMFKRLFLNEENIDNGLFQRFLIVIDETEEYVNPFNKIINKNKDKLNDKLDSYYGLVRFLYTNNFNVFEMIDRTKLNMEEGCLEYLSDWKERTNEKNKNKEFSIEMSINDFKNFFGKYDRNVFRLALIFRALRMYYSDDFKNVDIFNDFEPLRVEDFKNAVILTNYYFDNTIELFANINPYGNINIKNNMVMEILDAMSVDMPKKLLLALINDIYGYKCNTGKYHTARVRLREMITKKLIGMSVKNGKEVYNKKI